MDPEVAGAMRELRSFMFQRVYRNPVAKGEESKAKVIVQQLYAYYICHPQAMPDTFQPQLTFEGMERTVCDYIAGMTDKYAVDKYTELFIPSNWHVRGVIPYILRWKKVPYEKKESPISCPPAGTALVLLLGILLAAMTTLALEQGSLLSTLESFQAEPVLFVLNLWPVAAMALLVYFLLGNAWYSVSFTTLVWGLLSYVNLVKVEAREIPLFPEISQLLTEGMEAAGNYQLDMHWGKLAFF